MLGLTWADVDFDASIVRVRKALDRSGVRMEPKTPQAVRDVVLMPTLVRLLREHKLRSRFSGDGDFAFASEIGTPLYWRNVRKRGLDRALTRAGLDGAERPRLRWHDLRHTYASLLISQGLNVVYVSRQLGHASPDITLNVYAHLFDQVEHARKASDALEAAFAPVMAMRSGGSDGS